MKILFLYLCMVLVYIFTVSNITFASGFQLPDTGQHKCYNQSGEISCPHLGAPFYGQDSQYQGAEPAYRNNGDGTVTDVHTGLMWQQAPADIDKDGDFDINDASDWDTAYNCCNTLEYAGHSDWRTPDRRELVSLVNYGLYDSAINPVFYCPAYHCFWSSSHYIFNPYEAWYVCFSLGEVHHYNKAICQDVRCVRGGLFPTPIFQGYGDGTVTDSVSGLMWQQGDAQNDSGGRTWQQALAYCEQCTEAGYTDWRLPNIRELESLVDFDRWGDYKTMDPIFDYTPSAYWSSTTNVHEPYLAWYVNFYHGNMHYDGQKVSSRYVRCVRTPHHAIPWLYLLLLDD